MTLLKMLTGTVAIALTLAGCSDNKPSETPTDQVVIDVTIAGGNVTPTNKQVQAKVKQPIVVHIDSDIADQLHVHSSPEHTFDIKAAKDQTFTFTVNVPGKVDVELHHLDKTVATITAQ